MKVSVIIPTYQRSTFLIRAIESVLNQDYKDIEIIVVDDNGKGKQQEKTRSIVEKYSAIKLITYDKNKGGCYARNKGAEEATGEILMFLDDDDYFLNEKVRKHIAPFKEDSEITMALCNVKIADAAGNEIENALKYAKGDSLKSFILSGHIFTLMMAIKAKTFRELGGFDNIPRFQDKYFMYKFFANNYKVKFVNEELLVVIEHENDRVSKQNIKNESAALGVLHAFEVENFNLFNKKERVFLKNRYFLKMANIRAKGNIKERFKGVKYLLQGYWFFNLTDLKRRSKLLVRLLLSDPLYFKLKKIFFV
ncbi:glycosyltransferase family 2 protein [Gaetbulibacter aestuarii]|uniref:Glycosyltransferase family A protein n=1 Tax=Gaetbulibacter aestuarii TaxID=1502358 RepID=A0ABW7N162_9FLAO